MGHAVAVTPAPALRPLFCPRQFLVRDSAGGARSVAGVDWSFNSWGELSVPYDQDDAVATEILQAS